MANLITPNQPFPTSNKPKEVAKPPVLDTLENLVEKDRVGFMEDDELSLDNQPGISAGSISFNPEASLEKAANAIVTGTEIVASTVSAFGEGFKDLAEAIRGSEPKKQEPKTEREATQQADFVHVRERLRSLSEQIDVNRQRVVEDFAGFISAEDIDINQVATRSQPSLSKPDIRALALTGKSGIMFEIKSIQEETRQAEKAQEAQEESEVKPVVQMQGMMEGGTAGGQMNMGAQNNAG